MTDSPVYQIETNLKRTQTLFSNGITCVDSDIGLKISALLHNLGTQDWENLLPERTVLNVVLTA